MGGIGHDGTTGAAGTARAADGRTKRRSKAGAKTARKPSGGAAFKRRTAYAGFAVAAALLVLSLHHLTDGIRALTGAHWALALLLAVGVDAGMACAEAVLLSAADNEREMKRWAFAYVVATLAVSAALNAHVFAAHAPAGLGWAAAGLGLFIPAAVFALLKFSGKRFLSAR